MCVWVYFCSAQLLMKFKTKRTRDFPFHLFIYVFHRPSTNPISNAQYSSNVKRSSTSKNFPTRIAEISYPKHGCKRKNRIWKFMHEINPHSLLKMHAQTFVSMVFNVFGLESILHSSYKKITSIIKRRNNRLAHLYLKWNQITKTWNFTLVLNTNLMLHHTTILNRRRGGWIVSKW